MTRHSRDDPRKYVDVGVGVVECELYRYSTASRGYNNNYSNINVDVDLLCCRRSHGDSSPCLFDERNISDVQEENTQCVRHL